MVGGITLNCKGANAFDAASLSVVSLDKDCVDSEPVRESGVDRSVSLPA